MAFLGPMASIIPNFGEETGQNTPEYLDPVALMVAISSTQSEKLTGNGSGHEISHDMYISNDVAGSVIGKFRSNSNLLLIGQIFTTIEPLRHFHELPYPKKAPF